MGLDYFKDKLFDLLNDSEEMGIIDLNADERNNLFIVRTEDGNVFEIVCRQAADIVKCLQVAREAGKGKIPPEWLGMYFEDSPSIWYKAYKEDLVYSSIDLWKGCISIVPDNFAGAIVTKEFPIYKMKSDAILPVFLALLLRIRYYQKAFRAIFKIKTTVILRMEKGKLRILQLSLR